MSDRDEARAGHSRVVHAGDGEAHDRGGGAAQPQVARGCRAAKVPRDEERGVGGTDGDHDREAEQHGVEFDARGHLHSGHADVVHAGDCQAHGHGSNGKLDVAHALARGNPERKPRRADGDGDRKTQVSGCVRDMHGQIERQHADEMHGPDAQPHRDCPGGQPQPPYAPLRRMDALREIDRRERCENRDHYGQADEACRI